MAVTETRLQTKKREAVQTYEMNTFHQKSHFWGRLTIWMVTILTVSLPLYLSFILGVHPGWQPIAVGMIAYAAAIGYAWFMEPISYYPTLGISGTYQAFLTGNIANMCLPSAAAAQNAVGVEPGTKKGEVTAALAIGATSLMNMAILIVIYFWFLFSFCHPRINPSCLSIYCPGYFWRNICSVCHEKTAVWERCDCSRLDG
ncbi:hypothetical protein [Cytobacillus horneckiae]|uniref:hypothetical protein n=1 Tax=Cytobacillus horneckiae TaxID=549687 RepID=UPI003D1A32E6